MAIGISSEWRDVLPDRDSCADLRREIRALRRETIGLLKSLGEELTSESGGPPPAWITKRIAELQEPA